MDNDRGPIANTAVRYLEANPNLTVKQLYHSPAAVEAALLQRDIYAVVIIPEDFSRNISSSKPAPIGDWYAIGRRWDTTFGEKRHGTITSSDCLLAH